MDQLQLETFLDRNQNNGQQPDRNICERFIRKKFRCILIFMLSCIISTQLLITIFDKIDEKYFNKFLEIIITSTNTSSFFTPPMKDIRNISKELTQ